MKFEKTEVFNFNGAMRGMRNPKNSWHKSDSYFDGNNYVIGQNDMRLATTLIKAGKEHRKFLRQIMVCVDITAPLYWFKEMDTYKVGTTANSTSTMHKLAETPITLECFEIGDYNPEIVNDKESNPYLDVVKVFNVVENELIPFLEYLRQLYNRTKNKLIWKELVRWLPEGWLQTRTVTMNYENILSMVQQRKNHKLSEWSKCFIDWARSLPYAKEFLFYDEQGDNNA